MEEVVGFGEEHLRVLRLPKMISEMIVRSASMRESATYWQQLKQHFQQTLYVSFEAFDERRFESENMRGWAEFLKEISPYLRGVVRLVNIDLDVPIVTLKFGREGVTAICPTGSFFAKNSRLNAEHVHTQQLKGGEREDGNTTH